MRWEIHVLMMFAVVLFILHTCISDSVLLFYYRFLAESGYAKKSWSISEGEFGWEFSG